MNCQERSDYGKSKRHEHAKDNPCLLLGKAPEERLRLMGEALVGRKHIHLPRAAKAARERSATMAAEFNDKVRSKAEGVAVAREEAGLYPCREFNERNVMCSCVYATERGHSVHMEREAHSYGSVNARAAIVALSLQHGGMLTPDARPDRCAATAAASTVVAGATACPAAEQLGQYVKPPRAKAHYMTYAQLRTQRRLLREGLHGGVRVRG